MKSAANTAGKQRGRPFTKGTSGNPKGKPVGRRHRITIIVEQLLDGEAEKLTRKCVELALKGDSTALRLCMSDRYYYYGYYGKYYSKYYKPSED